MTNQDYSDEAHNLQEDIPEISYFEHDDGGQVVTRRMKATDFYAKFESGEWYRPEPSNDNTAKTSLIVTSAELCRRRKVAEFVIDGVFQKGYLYALTARTGMGKTAVGLTIAAHIALGLPLCGHDVVQGRVLYLAGENPDDITDRWESLSYAMGFDRDTIQVNFIPKAFGLTDEAVNDVILEANETGPYTAIFIDTDTAYFDGDDDNANLPRKVYASRLRRLLAVSGRPCVIDLCHPGGTGLKKPKPPFEPRGGGAFLNEIDGNTYLDVMNPYAVLLCRHPKFRGPQFKPLIFKLETYESRLCDAKGRPISSVRAIPQGSLDADVNQTATRKGKEEEQFAMILKALGHDKAMTYTDLQRESAIPPSSFKVRLKAMLAKHLIDFNEETKLYSKAK